MTSVQQAVLQGPSPLAALRARARLVERVLAGTAPVPPRWLTPGFVARVERIRLQLRPIRSATSLLASYGREAGVRVPSRPPFDPAEGALDAPLELAYALRLIELENGLPSGAWAAVATDSRRVAAVASEA